MSDKKNIERLFQEKFKDFESVPSPLVWENIEAELKEKKKRRVIPLWLRLSGVAAVLLIGFLISENFNTPNEPNNSVVNQEDSNQKSKESQDLVPMKNPVQENEVVTDAEVQNKKSETNSSQKSALVNEEIEVVKIQKNKKTTLVTKNKALESTVVSNSKNDSENDLKNLNSTEESKTIASKENQNNLKTQQNSTSIKEIEFDKKQSEIAQNKTKITQNNTVEIQKIDSTSVATVETNPLEELLKEKEKLIEAEPEAEIKRWQITSNVAPIYFGSASNGSPVDQQFADNSKDYEKNMSYGVGVNYALSKKWSVRGGLNKVTLGYNTNDIVYYAGLSDQARGSQSSNNQVYMSKGSAIIVEDNSAANVLSFDNVPGKKEGQLNQTMGFIEVPLELSYKIVDQKFGIELIGGMSTLFLNENNLSVVSSGMSASLGEANNLNEISFTSNIGLGFKYTFWKTFQANVEPKFKYQINTFSENNSGFKPYFIGIYSGLSFSF